MKTVITFILSITISLTLLRSNAQSGWQVNRYYNEQGESDVIYGNCYSIVAGYDIYGRAVYNFVQNCQRREWHSWYGRRGGYFWGCNNYTCLWQYQYEERTWWYFTWYNFTIPC